MHKLIESLIMGGLIKKEKEKNYSTALPYFAAK